MKGFIYSDQIALVGKRPIIGFGDADFCVKRIERARANAIIRANHYSKKVYSDTRIHLGVFMHGELIGVLQYGAAMNPASGGRVVDGTEFDQYLELNRMWLSDAAPRNSESVAISYSIKYIRAIEPRVKWIQSFADERCGGFGIVYQACSFGYYGEHTSVFWELDGEVYHNSVKTNTVGKHRKSFISLNAPENADRLISHELRQFRYIKFLDKSWEKRCNLKKQEYPKHYK